MSIDNRAVVDNTTAQLESLGREAYATGVSTTDPTLQDYAAGVEAVTRWLLGNRPDPRLQRMLNDAHLSERVRTDPRRRD